LLIRLQEQGSPPRIDRSYLSNLAGRDQTYLLAALRFFGLIGDNGEVTEDLDELAFDDERRRKKLGQLVWDRYADAVAVSEDRGTQAMLEEAFAQFDLAPEPKRKAITFFLKACEYAGIQLSPYFKI